MDRFQYVCIKNVNSELLPIKCVVSQGSILGSLLFILYITDTIHISKSIELIVFADATIYFSDKCLDSLINGIEPLFAEFIYLAASAEYAGPINLCLC